MLHKGGNSSFMGLFFFIYDMIVLSRTSRKVSAVPSGAAQVALIALAGLICNTMSANKTLDREL